MIEERTVTIRGQVETFGSVYYSEYITLRVRIYEEIVAPPQTDKVYYIGESVYDTNVNLAEFSFTSDTLDYRYEIFEILNLETNEIENPTIMEARKNPLRIWLSPKALG